MDSRERATAFLTWLNEMWTREGPVPLDEVARHMAPGIQFYLNGREMAVGIEAYRDRLNALKSQCPSLHVRLPAEEVIGEPHKAAIFWRETLDVDGIEREMVDAAYFHFDENGRIVKFFDVFSGADPVRD